MRRRAAVPDPFRVGCHASDRWLQFTPREQYDALGDDDLIHLDVMTLDDDGAPYKLCELVVSRGDLLRGVAAYGDPPRGGGSGRERERGGVRPAQESRTT